MKLEGIKIHPAANIFPNMDAESYERLKEDIRQNGQIEPAVFFKGELIDGRHRVRACQELNIQYQECEIVDDGYIDPFKWVISTNLHRRHLTESQRAMVSGRMANLKNGQVGNGRKVAPSKDGATTVSEAAAILNVSTKSVERAKSVIDKGSQALIEAVESGSVPVSLAEKLVKECDDKKTQTELAKQGKKAIREFLTPPADEVVEDEDDIVSDDGDGVLSEAKDLFNRCTNEQRILLATLWSEWIETKETHGC